MNPDPVACPIAGMRSGTGAAPDAWRRAIDRSASDLAVLARGPAPGGLGDGEPLAERFAHALWSTIVEPGDGDAAALVRALGPVEAAAALVADDPSRALRRLLAAREGEPGDATLAPRAARVAAMLARWRPRADLERVERLVHAAASLGGRFLVPGDRAWPARFNDLGDAAPLALWLRGDAALGALADASSASIAVVGSRASSAYGEQIAIELADGIAARRHVVVSGGAYGIDAAAHRAAVAGEHPTVAVLAGGIDRLYPPRNTVLLHRILDAGGAIVAEAPCGQPPTKWRFLQRNRLIAALTDATVVVEAAWRSGALNTAGHAAALGRPLGAVPGPVTSGGSAGCHRLVREYGATLVTSVDEALELAHPFDLAAPLALPGLDSAGAGVGLDGDALRVWDALAPRAPRGVPDLAARAGLAERDVRAALTTLELEGRAATDGAGWRRLGAARG